MQQSISKKEFVFLQRACFFKNYMGQVLLRTTRSEFLRG